MSDAVAKHQHNEPLRQILSSMSEAIGETLTALLDRTVRVRPGEEIRCTNAYELCETFEGPRVAVRGTLYQSFIDRSVVIVFNALEAITLAGCLMMHPEEVIEEQRAARALDADHLEGMGEVGNILCASLDSVLRANLGPNVSLRIRDSARVDLGSDLSPVLGRGELMVQRFHLAIGDYTEAEALLCIDRETALAWNNQVPIRDPGVTIELATEVPSLEPEKGSEPVASEPAAPPRRRRLSAFLTHPETAALLRACSQRLGFEVQRYVRTDIPNPAAHREEIVLIEIPVGEEKRFDWAKRIKQHHRDIPVVLLIHEPSRQRVVQGFVTKANVILAWPSGEDELCAKLEPLTAQEPDGS